MRERRDRHLAAAAHLEPSVADDDELVELLAAHYLDAFEGRPTPTTPTPSAGGRRSSVTRAA